jgi:hypothetical protein
MKDILKIVRNDSCKPIDNIIYKNDPFCCYIVYTNVSNNINMNVWANVLIDSFNLTILSKTQLNNAYNILETI